jgi:predicted  nucleic acid-binding Zn-ribbon protein
MRKGGHKLSKQFILDAFHDRHGDKYQYLFPDKFTVFTAITMICPIHGEFRQAIIHHMEGQGCPKCGYVKIHESQYLNRLEWIRRFESVHGRGTYDYSKVPDVIRQKDKVEIYCPEHNVTFYQSPIQHWRRGQGCPKCGIRKKQENHKQHLITRRAFEQRARAIHGLQYEYSELPQEFSLHDNIIIFCNEHNHAFFCKALDHLNGKGCPNENTE